MVVLLAWPLLTTGFASTPDHPVIDGDDGVPERMSYTGTTSYCPSHLRDARGECNRVRGGTYGGTYAIDITLPTQNYVLLERDAECSTGDTELGREVSLSDCATLCEEHAQ